jgi:hypothetical protein
MRGKGRKEKGEMQFQQLRFMHETPQDRKTKREELMNSQLSLLSLKPNQSKN